MNSNHERNLRSNARRRTPLSNSTRWHHKGLHGGFIAWRTRPLHTRCTSSADRPARSAHDAMDVCRSRRRLGGSRCSTSGQGGALSFPADKARQAAKSTAGGSCSQRRSGVRDARRSRASASASIAVSVGISPVIAASQRRRSSWRPRRRSTTSRRCSEDPALATLGLGGDC